jgi:hypothetical protein
MLCRVLMLMDNAPVHGGFEIVERDGFDTIELSAMLIVFLPANTTSHVQPLDQGIINSFKLKYRAFLVRWLIRQYDGLPAGTNLSKVVPDAKQALLWSTQAWQQVTEECISNCWRHAGILSNPPPKRGSRLRSLECDGDTASRASAQSTSAPPPASALPPASAPPQLSAPASIRPGAESHNPLADDLRGLDGAIQELVGVLREADKQTFQPMTAAEIVLYQEDEERVGTMETLTDAEIVALVNSENNPDCIEEEDNDDQYVVPSVRVPLSDVLKAAEKLAAWFETDTDGAFDSDKRATGSDIMRNVLDRVKEVRLRSAQQAPLTRYFL